MDFSWEIRRVIFFYSVQRWMNDLRGTFKIIGFLTPFFSVAPASFIAARFGCKSNDYFISFNLGNAEFLLPVKCSSILSDTGEAGNSRRNTSNTRWLLNVEDLRRNQFFWVLWSSWNFIYLFLKGFSEFFRKFFSSVLMSCLQSDRMNPFWRTCFFSGGENSARTLPLCANCWISFQNYKSSEDDKKFQEFVSF